MYMVGFFWSTKNQKVKFNNQIFKYWNQMDTIFGNVSNVVIIQAIYIIQNPFLCF